MRKTEISENAGKVWHALNEVHEISLEGLAKRLQLEETEIALSIGWLACENKIHFEEKDGRTFVSTTEVLNFFFG